MPRFVVLYHQMPQDGPVASHWDVMFDDGDALKTWALDSPPDTEGTLPARQLADHRRAYLEYEGPISGGRGNVTRWDAGEFSAQSDCRDDHWHVELEGTKLIGRLIIACRSEDQRWSFTLEPDVDAT